MWEILSLQSWNFFKLLYSPLYHGLDFIYLHTQINTWRTPFQFSLIQNHLKLCWVTIRRVLYLHISCFKIKRKRRSLAVLSYKEIVLIALVFGKRTPLYIYFVANISVWYLTMVSHVNNWFLIWISFLGPTDLMRRVNGLWKLTNAPAKVVTALKHF